MSPSTFTFSSSGEKCFTSRFTENLSFSSRICKTSRWLQAKVSASSGSLHAAGHAHAGLSTRTVWPPAFSPGILIWLGLSLVSLFHSCTALQHIKCDAFSQDKLRINIFWGIRKRFSQSEFIKTDSFSIFFWGVWRFPVSARLDLLSLSGKRNWVCSWLQLICVPCRLSSASSLFKNKNSVSQLSSTTSTPLLSEQEGYCWNSESPAAHLASLPSILHFVTSSKCCFLLAPEVEFAFSACLG